MFFYNNHPIRYVRLVGVVVAFDILDRGFVFAIDDGSGSTIDVRCDRPKQVLNDAPYDVKSVLAEIPKKGLTPSRKEVDLSDIDVGTVVKVKGLVGVRWGGEKQIRLERIWIVQSTSEEILAWEETSDFRSQTLSRPWTLSDKEVRRAQRKAGGRGPPRAKAGPMKKSSGHVEKAEKVAQSAKRTEKARSRQCEREQRERILRERASKQERGGTTVSEARGQENVLGLSEPRSDLVATSNKGVVATEMETRDSKRKVRDIERQKREEYLRERTERPCAEATTFQNIKDPTQQTLLTDGEKASGLESMPPRNEIDPDDIAQMKKEQVRERRAAERVLREQYLLQRRAKEALSS